MRANVRAVVFDLDDTLLDRRRSFELFACDQWERFRPSLGGAEQISFVDALTELDGDGYAPRKSMFEGLLTRLELSPSLADSLLGDYRDGFPKACLLFPSVAQTLRRIRESGLKLGLITNGSIRMQRRKLQHLNLTPLFDTILISDLEGVSKPDPQIFCRACRRLDTDPAQTVFVGDHPEVDVAGACAAGMQTVWRRLAGQTQTVLADGVVEDIEELLPWLGL